MATGYRASCVDKCGATGVHVVRRGNEWLGPVSSTFPQFPMWDRGGHAGGSRSV